MKTYDVTMRAVVTKTLRIEADNEEDARELAYGEFTAACDGGGERYEEDILNISEVK